MFSKVGKDDDNGLMIIFMGFLFVIIVILYVATLIAVVGSVYGGGLSIYNYILSFKENIIKENFVSAN